MNLNDLNQRLNKLTSAFYKLILPGVIKEVKHDEVSHQTFARISFAAEESADGERDGLTGFVPVFAPAASDGVKIWTPVLIGGRGVLISPGGMPNSGWFLSGLYSTGVPPPIDRGRDHRIFVELGGMTLDLDAAGGTLTVSGVARTDIAGDLRVFGNIRAEGDISTAAGISHNEHTHTDPTGGGGDISSPPNR